MDPNQLTYRAIGLIRSPHDQLSGTPIQPAAARGVRGLVELDPNFQTGLEDVEGFSHLILIYHFHRTKDVRMRVIPFLDDCERGVFATRAPTRPNPIGLSVVRLKGIRDNILTIEDVDILDKTPLLDLKPYVPAFDQPGNVKTGWIPQGEDVIGEMRADDRFT